MKRSALITGALTIALLLPAIATAAVVVNNGIAVSFTPNHQNLVYLTQGSGYAQANSTGFFSVNGDNANYTNLTIELSSVPGSGYVVLTNVLEIYNATSASGIVNVWINGTLPSGLSMFESSSPVTFNGNTISGTQLLAGGSTSSEIHLTGSGVAGYIGFKLGGFVSGTTTLSLQYTIS